MTQQRTAVAVDTPALSLIDRRTIDLGFDLLEAALNDASVLDDIPNGATLVLLPGDDPEYVDRMISLGVDAIRRGRNVFFRHVEKPAGDHDE